ncbi:MAG TPA: P1 family peptidase, partial [Blastocatellia bacterium]|nr:P1 family peptidase [Blastocatellia bacterium]
AALGGYTVGVLVQTNFGGILTIAGAPVGRDLGRYYLKEELERPAPEKRTNEQTSGPGNPVVRDGGVGKDLADGSVIIVIATDAPVDSRNLRRMAARAMMGLGRTGSSAGNGSGDYAISFSTAASVRIRPTPNQSAIRQVESLSNDAISPLFLGVVEATEEAVYNSLFRATTTRGRGRTVEALPIDRTLEILRKYGALPRDGKAR